MDNYFDRIKKFNEKYTHKTIWDCNYLGKWVNFDFEYITFCCSRTTAHTMDNPPVCSVDDIKNDRFCRELFYEKLIDIYEKNQQETGPCNGCKHLKKQKFAGIDLTHSIEHISYNNYRGCNSRCVYCFQPKSKLIEPYKAYELVEIMNIESMLAPEVMVEYGGGESTILPDFVKYLKAADKPGWKMTISSSAIIFSEYIASGLKKGIYSLHISPDAGTEETYYKIKGRNAFKKVWENIRRYCESSENVFVRYILFSLNSAKEEIDAFVNMCIKNNVTHVVISAEHEAAREIHDRIYWHYGEDEIQANTYLAIKCMKCGLATHLYLSGMSPENEKQVLSNLAVRGIQQLTDNGKVYIFGIGENGKRLIERLSAAGALISGFVDSYVKVKNNEYHNVPQVECCDIDKEKDSILISPDNYKEIEKTLVEYGYKNIYKFYLD